MSQRITDPRVEVTVNDDGVCRIVKGTVKQWLPDGVVFDLNCAELEPGNYALQFRNIDIERAQTFGEFEPGNAEVVDIETRIIVEEVRSGAERGSRCTVTARYQGSVRILNHSITR